MKYKIKQKTIYEILTLNSTAVALDSYFNKSHLEDVADSYESKLNHELNQLTENNCEIIAVHQPISLSSSITKPSTSAGLNQTIFAITIIYKEPCYNKED